MLRTTFELTTPLGDKVSGAYYIPNNYVAGSTIPVLIALSGNGEWGTTATDITRLINNNNFNNIFLAADRLGFAVVTPLFIHAANFDYDSTGKPYRNWQPEWAGGEYVNLFVEWAKSNLPVDRNRIYMTGLSGGGGGTWSYITKRKFADKIAAALPVCPTELSGSPDWVAAASVPNWSFCGTLDAFYGGAQRMAANANGIFTPIPNAYHSIWGEVYGRADIYSWMLSKTKSITSPVTTTTTTSTTTQKPLPKQTYDINVFADGTIKVTQL